MAKDDYGVLMIYILAYLYDCAKCGAVPKEDELDDSLFRINDSYFKFILRLMQDDGLIKGLNIVNVRGRYNLSGFSYAEITSLGISKLKDESFETEAKKALKGFGGLGNLAELF